MFPFGDNGVSGKHSAKALIDFQLEGDQRERSGRFGSKFFSGEPESLKSWSASGTSGDSLQCLQASL